jgi:hypothetical protein
LSHLLSDTELADLTGVEQAAAQIRVLQEHGLRPVVRRDGKPRVTWEAVTAAMLKAEKAAPNFGALRKAG